MHHRVEVRQSMGVLGGRYAMSPDGGEHASPATPDLDPYFVPDGHGPKGRAKWLLPREEDIRRDLLPTEAAFHVAGMIGMVLGASGFVIFAVPVSGMLRRRGEP